MAAHLHPFRCRISNRLQNICTPGRAGNTQNKCVHIKQTLWDQSSVLPGAFYVDPTGTTAARDEDGRHAFTSTPEAKPSYRCAIRARLRSAAARSRTHSDAAGRGALRVWRPIELPAFSDHKHRLATLRHGRRRIGGNRDHRQRWFGRRLLIHGRRKHAEPGGGAKRRRGLSAQGEHSKKGIRPWWTVRTLGASVHAGADYADGPDCCLQPASLGRPAVVPLAAPFSRPSVFQRIDDDP